VKVIIAGGRDYQCHLDDVLMLHDLHLDNNFTEIVSGAASGADREGEIFACDICIPVKRFPADWETHGKAAGPIRNKQMAQYADAVILFPGGKGTASMRKLAKEYGLKILYDADNP